MSRWDTVLVTTTWLNERLHGDHVHPGGLRIVEVDEDTGAYFRRHIPGAVPVSWTADLQDPNRRDLVDADAFGALQDRLGVTRDTTVVLYGGNHNWFAAYAYWCYKIYGHADVVLLDGGRMAWELENHPMATTVTTVRPTTGYGPKPPDPSIRALRDEVRSDVLGRHTAALVDVRSPEEYRGEAPAPPGEAAVRRGHIPGAVNIPWASAVDPCTGRFLPAGPLATLYIGHGVTPDKDVVTYCRIGERSAHSWFVLHELLGYPRVRNYDGSWAEWGSLVGVPIER